MLPICQQLQSTQKALLNRVMAAYTEDLKRADGIAVVTLYHLRGSGGKRKIVKCEKRKEVRRLDVTNGGTRPRPPPNKLKQYMFYLVINQMGPPKQRVLQYCNQTGCNIKRHAANNARNCSRHC